MPDTADYSLYGIRPEDEGVHDHDPSVELWNESWFWDFYNADGSVAGHCRFGVYPNQNRVWLWLYLHSRGEWIAFDEPRLPLDRSQLPEIAYRRRGVEFEFAPDKALREGRLRVSGRGRVVGGPRTGRIVTFGVDLRFTAIGVPHSPGQARGAGHESADYDASRFEQPVVYEGSIALDDHVVDFAGRGERDHSWGPRYWNMMWTFLAVNHPEVRLQAVHVELGPDAIVQIGYVSDDDSVRELSGAEFDLLYDDADLAKPVHGGFALVPETGPEIVGTIMPLTGVEIDMSHNLDPVRHDSMYRRTLIQVSIDGGLDATVNALGWLEDHRFVDGW